MNVYSWICTNPYTKVKEKLLLAPRRRYFIKL